MGITKKMLFLIVLSVTSTTLVKGQDLLTNGGFEEYHQCPHTNNAGPSFVDGYLVDWHQTLGGRMKHTDCYIDDNDFWHYAGTDSMLAKVGNGYTTSLRFRSIINLSGKQRDYLMSPLKEPMVADSTYRVSYYLHCNRNYALIDHFGATFVRDTSDLFVEQDSNGLALYTEDYVGYRDTFLGPDDQWHHIEGCYTAKGGERWIAMGHFLPFDEVKWHPTYKGRIANSAGIFLLDDVSIELTSPQIEEDHELIVCDGQVVLLPQPNNPNLAILDSAGRQIDSVMVDWPNTYTYTYYDACFGELGTITIDSETCFDQVDLKDVICEEEEVYFDQILNDTRLYVVDPEGTAVNSFKPLDSGNTYFTVFHQKYGEVGQVEIETVECDNCEVHLPNVLSLRSELNNKFAIATLCTFETFQLSVYDRWGNEHFSSNDPSVAWTPSQSMESGVYVYMLKYKFLHPLDIFGNELLSGTLTILK